MKKTDETMIEEFIENKRSHEEQLTVDFAKAIIDCELRKKDITTDIKEIKAQAKDEGIQVQHIMKVVTEIKQELKTDILVKREKESIYDILMEDSDIRFKLETLISAS